MGINNPCQQKKTKKKKNNVPRIKDKNIFV